MGPGFNTINPGGFTRAPSFLLTQTVPKVGREGIEPSLAVSRTAVHIRYTYDPELTVGLTGVEPVLQPSQDCVHPPHSRPISIPGRTRTCDPHVRSVML